MIGAISLSELAAETGANMQGKDLAFSSVSIDTRTLSQGDLYIALKGEHFDGHLFVKQAIEKGSAAVVVAANRVDAIAADLEGSSCLIVDETLKALGICARINRKRFSGPVIGLTGSSGKTSTKNMLECILKERGETCATQANFNNEIGVPLTLLSINDSHQFAVVEMGARRIGDIRYLSTLVQADVAILLNAGTAHIDIFGSRENIAKAKGEIFTELRSGAAAVVNYDDGARVDWLTSLTGKAVLTFSLINSQADVYASDILSDAASSEYFIHYRGFKQHVRLPVPGQHNIQNSLAATAAALHLGFSLVEIARGLEKLNAVAGRLMTIPCSESLELIDDSYNANPASMKAAIDVLALKPGFKVAVLGEMGELGDFSRKLHLELAKYVAESTVDRVYLISPYAQEMADIIGIKAIAAASKSEILECLAQLDHVFDQHNDYNELSKTSILVKGSRFTAMDELLDMIIRRTH
jgi:UDP-N-acetylmuramoyl-tripeptide--D-alanyl-D-alanine ligase